MPRQIDLRLESLLGERASGITHAKLAKRLGISSATVRAYIENRWTVLDRTVLERLADFLECDAGTLLTTTESRFFEPIRALDAAADSSSCLYVRREDADVMASGRALAYRDYRAMEKVETLLRNNADRMTSRQVSAVTAAQFDNCLLHNCVVLGSPMVNPAAEIAICHAFGAAPFDAAARAALPFIFRSVESAENRASSVVEFSRDGRQGIWLREGNKLIDYDYWPPEEFKRKRIVRGRDCGVIIVANQQPADSPGSSRKLIVLSGFGGTGTEAAATALVHHFRDLEPRKDEKAVWGVIEVFYEKPKDSTTREDLSYNWRYRVGGRCPVTLVSRRSRDLPRTQNTHR